MKVQETNAEDDFGEIRRRVQAGEAGTIRRRARAFEMYEESLAWHIKEREIAVNRARRAESEADDLRDEIARMRMPEVSNQ